MSTKTPYNNLTAPAAAVWLGAFVLCVAAPPDANAKVFLTRDEALELAFPNCEVERQTHFLTADQRNQATELAGSKVRSRLVVTYDATCGDAPSGRAYFDTHRVRTLEETLMVTVGPGGTVMDVQILSFLEPQEYIPVRKWYELFLNRLLDSELRLKKGIHAVSGATLTAGATTDAVRRALALDRVLRGHLGTHGGGQ